MILHEIDPSAHIRAQVRGLGIQEPLKFEQTVLYRFFNKDGRLLYVGVTRRPFERWQAHRRVAQWWPDVSLLAFEFHPHERAALDAEVAAIKSEEPLHNRRSSHAPLTDSSCIPHEESLSSACGAPPRVGVGVGEGLGSVVLHASSLTGGGARPVDNFAAASPERTSPVPCSAYGDIRRWGR